MSPSIKNLIADTTVAAITLRQALEPIEGRDVPIFPPTYPPNKERKNHRFDTPYTINETPEGIRVCDLDSVQSQANRMEGAFTGPLAEVTPAPCRAGGKPTGGSHRPAPSDRRRIDPGDQLRHTHPVVLRNHRVGRSGATGTNRSHLAGVRRLGLP